MSVPLPLPWETPERLSHLHERLEGKRISRLTYLVGEEFLPVGWAGLALEFPEYDRLIVVAVPASRLDPTRRAALIWRWWMPIQLPTRANRAHHQRTRAEAHEPAPDPIQRQVEGQVIRGVLARRVERTAGGGERMPVELANGSRLWFQAEYDSTEWAMNAAGEAVELPIATLEAQVERPGDRLVHDLGAGPGLIVLP